jgi:TatD DNase family protein
MSAEGTTGSSSPPTVRVILGVHPHNAKDFLIAQGDMIELATHPLTCAIGEIGLDYYYDHSPRDVQRAAFRTQLELAHELGLPAVIHLREAHGDGSRILRDVGVPPAGCILHCYNLGAEPMREFLDMGCYVSFAGPVTFKKSDEIREAAALVPADRLLTETDCPFMAPEPFRGRKNEPAYTVFTAARIAEARGETMADFAHAAYANALRVFGQETS